MTNQNPYGPSQVPATTDSAPYMPRPAQVGQASPVPPASWQQSYAHAQFAPAAPQAGKKRNWVPLIVVLALVALIVFGIAACSKSLSTIGSAGDVFEGNGIAIINMSGTIQYDGSECSPEGLKQLLDEAEEDDHVKAVVLRVNSGGGVATAGEEMAAYVRDFSKPVVISCASLNASAAYEISSQADYIYVAKTTEIGAIGTIMQVSDLSGLMDKLGVSMESIASSDSKDSTYGMRPLTDEERQYYQDMIDQINGVFIENVAQGRNMSDADVRKLATGLTFTGLAAVDNGLADEVGTLEDACDKAAELGNCPSDYEKRYLQQSGNDLQTLLNLLSESESGQNISAGDLAAALKEIGENDATIK